MKTLQDIKEKLEEINHSDFKIEDFNYYGKKHKISVLLRNALICTNSISSIDDISKEEEIELYKLLDGLMKNKIKELNPNFSEEILNNMVNSYKRDYVIYPMDIFVIDDAVFRKEGEFDDFGSIYRIRTLMFENMKPYYNVSNMNFTLEKFLFSSLFSSTRKERLTQEENKYTSKFISDNINSIYKKNITRPLYELNNDNSFYGNAGITSGEVCGVNCYINMKFGDIGRSLKSKQECDIKLCIQNGEDIVLYYVHQSFKDDKPVWNVVKTDSEVWRLTEEVLKLENKSSNAVLTKKKKV